MKYCIECEHEVLKKDEYKHPDNLLVKLRNGRLTKKAIEAFENYQSQHRTLTERLMGITHKEG